MIKLKTKSEMYQLRMKRQL